jgi:CDP-diacylglycerol pyrophosphatase
LKPTSKSGLTVKDYQASIEKLRRDAAEAALIRDLATNPTKRERFDRLHQHLSLLAEEVERALNSDNRSKGRLIWRPLSFDLGCLRSE